LEEKITIRLGGINQGIPGGTGRPLCFDRRESKDGRAADATKNQPWFGPAGPV